MANHGGLGMAAGQAALQEQLGRLGPPPAQARADDPSRAVALTLEYVGQNRLRLSA